MSENRKEHRFKVVLPIRITYGGNEIISRTENLSRLGTYTEINREIPTGENVDVTLVLPAYGFGYGKPNHCSPTHGLGYMESQTIALPAYTQDLSPTEEVKCQGNVFRSALLRQSATNKYYGVGIFFMVFTEDKHREKLSDFIEYLAVKEEQEIKVGLKRRREKEETEKIVKHSEEFYVQEEEFRKESLNLLHKISSQLEEINRLLQAENKKQ